MVGIKSVELCIQVMQVFLQQCFYLSQFRGGEISLFLRVEGYFGFQPEFAAFLVAPMGKGDMHMSSRFVNIAPIDEKDIPCKYQKFAHAHCEADAKVGVMPETVGAEGVGREAADRSGDVELSKSFRHTFRRWSSAK